MEEGRIRRNDLELEKHLRKDERRHLMGAAFLGYLSLLYAIALRPLFSPETRHADQTEAEKEQSGGFGNRCRCYVC